MNKNIVLCYDGTSNEFGQNNTNIVKTFEFLQKNDKQIAFYDAGVGTFDTTQTISTKIKTLMGKAFGYGLQKNINDGYEYLMSNFVAGDQVFIFGFSRGAFTARALAGMMYHFGVLQKDSKNLIPYVARMYNEKNFKTAKRFKEVFSKTCKPYFIGVWDTVASLGYLYGKKFFDQKLNHDTKYAYQAIAIDEQRKKFPISIWDENQKINNQIIEQVWFAGVHADNGGGYLEHGLSDLTLAWMMDQAEAAGLKLVAGWQQKLQQNRTGKLHKSRAGMWKIWQKSIRKIPANAKIHQSVFDRKEQIKNYLPTNIPKKYQTVSNVSYLASTKTHR